AAEIDDDAAIFDAFDDAVDDVADAILEFLILPVALGLAHLLHDHLLGRLRSNAAIFQRRQRVGDGVADWRGGRPPARSGWRSSLPARRPACGATGAARPSWRRSRRARRFRCRNAPAPPWQWHLPSPRSRCRGR